MEKTDGACYTMNARYAIKIEKIPNHLHIYVHNNLTLCRPNLNPYCLGRKAAFFSVGI
jgi:hypothetical protein